MTKTKHSLLMSAIALLLCCSMLIGTTFAWFTDSVTSSNNKIQSGTLLVDLELLVKNEDGTTTWTSLKDSKAPIFNYLNWEPGYTDVKLLRIQNEGTLALKWVAQFVSEKALSELADVIDVYVSTTATTYPTDREAVATWDYKGTVADFVNTIETTTNGTLLAKDDVDGSGDDEAYLGIALKMQETADNKYQGLDLGGAFDIRIFATQLTAEKDSFDEKYDEDAVYADAYVTNADEFAAAIAEGGTIALMEDIEISSINVPKGVTATINLNGNDISGTSTKDSGNQSAFVVKGDLIVEGTGTVSHIHTGANMGWNNLTSVFSVEGGTLTLGENVSVVNNGGSDMAFGVDVNSTLGATTLNVDGATIYSTYTGVRLFSNNKTQAATVNFNKGSIEGDNRDIWNQIASVNIPAENGVVNIADEYNYTTEATSFGGAKYFFIDYLVSTADDLKDALADGGNIVLTDNIELTNTLTAKKDVVIDLNGNTITAPSSGNMFQSSSDSDPSIIITSSTAGAEINVSGGDTSVLLGYGSTLIKNVTINVTGCDNASPNPFKVYGDLTLGEGTVVNVDYLGTALINNNGKVAISIDGAEINVGTFKTNSTAIITLNQASTLEMKNTKINIDNFVLSSFGGNYLVSKVDGVTIEGCTFDVTDSNGAECTFVASTEKGKYILAQN